MNLEVQMKLLIVLIYQLHSIILTLNLEQIFNSGVYESNFTYARALMPNKVA